MKEESRELNKLIIMNRQPTLWRHGISTVRVIPSEDYEDNTIGLSPLILEAYNADFDGDTVALYEIHDIDALKEMSEKAYLKNVTVYDSDGKKISTIRHEALYAAYVLTENIETTDFQYLLEIEELKDLPEDLNYYNDCLSRSVKFRDKFYTYGICLINKWCGFNKIIINRSITKKENNYISEEIYNYHNDNKLYYKYLTELNKRLLFFISISKHNTTIDLDEMINIVDDKTKELFKKLPENNVYLGYQINEGLVDKCLNNMNKKSKLYKLYKSGSRFSKKQLARSCINIGYIADDNNIVHPTPIRTNLISGLTITDFLLGAPGSRKGKFFASHNRNIM